VYPVRTLLSSRCRIIVALADVSPSFALPVHGYVVCINFPAIELLPKMCLCQYHGQLFIYSRYGCTCLLGAKVNMSHGWFLEFA